MSDLQSLHTQARKLILTLRAGLERLEAAEGGAGRASLPGGFAADLHAQLVHLQKISIDMDGMWRMQMMREAASKRDIWKRKVEAVAEEADAMRSGLDRCGSRQARRQTEEAQHAELLQRRADGRPAMDLGAEVASRRHVENSKRAAEEAYLTGVDVLGAMAGQRDRLKSAQRRVFDVLNAVGLSDSVLRVAERRLAVDKLIAYGGMLGVTVLLIVLYWWLKSS
jgi:Golgi SNAP receptor complex protein 2